MKMEIAVTLRQMMASIEGELAELEEIEEILAENEYECAHGVADAVRNLFDDLEKLSNTVRLLRRTEMARGSLMKDLGAALAAARRLLDPEVADVQENEREALRDMVLLQAEKMESFLQIMEPVWERARKAGEPEKPETYSMAEEERRKAAWAAYRDKHPEVLASWDEQNGFWPPAEGSED